PGITIGGEHLLRDRDDRVATIVLHGSGDGLRFHGRHHTSSGFPAMRPRHDRTVRLALKLMLRMAYIYSEVLTVLYGHSEIRGEIQWVGSQAPPSSPALPRPAGVGGDCPS